MIDKLFDLLILKSYDHPRRTFFTLGLITVLLSLSFPTVVVDVDPENMLEHDEPARVFHDQMKERMDIQDMIVLGVTLDDHPDGVFNPDSLGRILKLSKFIYGLDGVVSQNLTAPDRVDAIEPAGPGAVTFHRLMETAPADREGALRVRDLALSNPFLNGTMVSNDGKGMAIMAPIVSKDKSWALSKEIHAKIDELNGPETWHLTGLPVAEDTFGVEMFIQMAVSAPMAMGLITLLMWFFFGNFRLVAGSIMTALISVLITMGAFVATGQTLHIMSSMIPIFIMPIAVLDDIHILSQFYDKYEGDARATLVEIMHELWKPMIFTSATSAAGFVSLALAPIPPVRVFGVFTAIGIVVAWAVTMAFLPAYIATLPKERLAEFGLAAKLRRKERPSKLAGFLHGVGDKVWSGAWPIVVIGLIVAGLAWVGIMRINVNDNPMKWFEPDHPIRAADQVFNSRFAGSYIAYLSLDQDLGPDAAKGMMTQLEPKLGAMGDQGAALADVIRGELQNGPITALMKGRAWIAAQSQSEPETAADEEPDFDFMEASGDGGDRVDQNRRNLLAMDQMLAEALTPFEVVKDPEFLHWMTEMTAFAVQSGLVAKANSVADLVKKVNQELHEGERDFYRIPNSKPAVMETYLSFQSSHDLHRLWNMITSDYGSAVLMFSMKSGDNRDVEHAVHALDAWVAQNPPPVKLQTRWFGLSYINVLWQEKMVEGMTDALMGSGVVVFIMMLFLLRHVGWALLSFVPLCMAIGAVYGSIGLMGKDYDMPVAVISALALGLSVDFAIHLIVCLRQFGRTQEPREAMRSLFGEPARGIWRNAVVVALGFTPLLIAPLVPYQTVGMMMAGILITSAISTLILLPAVIRIGKAFLFKAPVK